MAITPVLAAMQRLASAPFWRESMLDVTDGVALRSRRAGQDIQHETAGIFVVLAIK
jgi:hypothetical protein